MQCAYLTFISEQDFLIFDAYLYIQLIVLYKEFKQVFFNADVCYE